MLLLNCCDPPTIELAEEAGDDATDADDSAAASAGRDMPLALGCCGGGGGITIC